ncbi:MAG TPA: thiamine pyrophosphate-dependent dehydrogenase E1 component subunit alpha [Pirellulales bacterium]|nr:thiamine pyrophosphate-dependent dehydrogenase E1 component subunit alpha [Pirellulales bacterium]
MLRIRLIEEGIAELYAEQQMRCPVHLCIGQEAVSAGVCDVLGADDQVMSSHRAHGHYLAKGGNLPAMMAEMYGKATGCSGGMGGSMHLIDLAAGFVGATPIVGSTIPISVGLAFASLLRGEPRVVVAFFGEGATEEGTFHEALNFAALKRLSILFVCENNLYSVYSPLSVRRPAGRPIYRLADGHGIESRQGDGNDVEEVHALAQEALGQIRAGAGPMFLEFATYRWREHCGPNFDNRIGYRTEEEFLRWREQCPVERQRRKGIENGWLSESDVKGWSDEIRDEFSAAVAFAKASHWPETRTMLDHVYSAANSPTVEVGRRAA